MRSTARANVATRNPFNSCAPRVHRAAALAVAACFGAGYAHANPTNPVVVNGAAQFTTTGNLLSITNTPNAIINWGSFSIGANEITRFVQQSASSSVLNRVIGQSPSSILGALQSNGRVFVINPNGIVFGAGSQINVGGLVASTLNLSDADFLAGRLRFENGLGNPIFNSGNITTTPGGNVYMIGSAVTNNGIITSPRGEVILAAGNSVELVNPGTPDLRVEIVAPDNKAVNLGSIAAEAGRIGIYAGLINQAGSINANSVVVGENGQITLMATQNTTLEAGSTTTANGPSGGTVTVQSGDTTMVSGTVEAKGQLELPGVEGKGGEIKLLGNQVGLTGNASVDASGTTGGGSVLIGGDFQGKTPDVQNAFRTYVGENVNIKADATTSGDGGKVVVWGDDVTRFYGNISARGGAQSGNGGNVEVSGHNYLDFNGGVNASAPNGNGGTLLLDPSDITISTNANSNISVNPFTGTGPGSNLNDAAVTGPLNGGTAVTINASGGTGAVGFGFINVDTPLTYNSAQSLTLQVRGDNGAGGTINVNKAITNNGTGGLNFQGLNSGVPNANQALINVNADLLLNGGSISNSAISMLMSGTTQIKANTLTSAFSAQVKDNSNITLNVNNVTFSGMGVGTSFGGTQGNAKLTLIGNYNNGDMTVGSSTQVAPSVLTITGNASTVGTGTVVVNGSTISVGGALTAGTGGMTISGTGASITAAGITSNGTATFSANSTATVNPGATNNFTAPTINANAGSNVTLNGLGTTFSTQFNVTGATVNLGGNLSTATGSMSVSGASVITGVGNIGLNTTGGGALNWSGGTIGAGGGTLTTAAGVTTNITGATTLNRNWTANGPVNMTGAGDLTIAGATTTYTQAANTLTLNSTAAREISGAGKLINQGTLLVSQAAVIGDGTGTFNNQGTVSLSGPLSINASGTDSAVSIYKLNSASDLTFAGGIRTIDGTIQRTATVGGVVFTGGATTFGVGATYDTTINATVVNGGTAIFNNNVNLPGNYSIGSGAATFNGSATLNGANSFTGGSSTFNGNATLTGTNTFSGGTTVFNGTTTNLGNNNLSISGSTTTVTFGDAAGDTASWSGAATKSISMSDGLINGAGLLDLNAAPGAFNWSGGAIGGTGTLTTGAGLTTTLSQPVTLGRNWTMNGPGNISGSGTVTLANGAAWTVGGASTLTLSSTAAAPQISGTGAFVNNGVTNVNSAFTVGNTGDALTFNNNSGLTVASGKSLKLNVGSNGTETGNYTVNGGSIEFAGGTRSIGGASSGQVNLIAAGSKAIFSGGAVTFTNNVSTQYSDTNASGGGGTFISGGTVTFDKATTFQQQVTLSAGTLAGAANLIANNQFNWSGGTISGTGTLTTNTTAAALTNPTGTLTLQRNWNAGGGINLSNTAATILDITNAANTLTLGGASTINNSAATNITGAGTLQNNSTLSNTGAGTLTVGSVLNNAGTVGVTGGNVTVSNSGADGAPGTYTVAANKTLEFAGGTRTFAGGSVGGAGNLKVSGGALNGNGALNVGGNFDWTGGTITNANLPLSVTGASTINLPGQAVALTNATNDFKSTLTVTAASAVINDANALTTVLNTTGANTLTAGGAITATGSFANINATSTGAGATVNLSSTAPALTVAGAASNNGNIILGDTAGNLVLAGNVSAGTGTLNTSAKGTQTLQSGTVSAGNYALGGAVLTLTGGALNITNTLTVNPGATLDLGTGGQTVNAGTLSISNNGLLVGIGTVNGNVVNAGLVAPGNSPGTLNITGNFATTGTVHIEVGGAIAGTQFDRINVGGNTSLGGLLSVTQLSGFVPPAGSGYQFINTSGTSTGNFASTNITPAFTGMSVVYGTNFTDLVMPAATSSVSSSPSNNSLLVAMQSSIPDNDVQEITLEEAKKLPVEAVCK